MAQTRAELVDLREKQALEPAAGPHGSDVMHLLHLKPAHHHDHHHSAADLGKDQPQQVCLSLACAGGGGGGGGACDRDATQDCSRASCILAHLCLSTSPHATVPIHISFANFCFNYSF